MSLNEKYIDCFVFLPYYPLNHNVRSICEVILRFLSVLYIIWEKSLSFFYIMDKEKINHKTRNHEKSPSRRAKLIFSFTVVWVDLKKQHENEFKIAMKQKEMKNISI